MIVYINEDSKGKILLAQSSDINAKSFDVSVGLYNELKKDIFFYKIENGEIVFDGNLAGIFPFHSVEQKIESLKQQLSSSDYKIIKCFEAQLIGGEQPYDIVALHSERQKIRDEIKSLENE